MFTFQWNDTLHCHNNEVQSVTIPNVCLDRLEKELVAYRIAQTRLRQYEELEQLTAERRKAVQLLNNHNLEPNELKKDLSTDPQT